MKYLLTLVMAFLTLLPAFTQSDGLTVEEAYLQTKKKVQRLESIASQEDRDLKLMAVQDIQRMIENGEVGPSDVEIIGILNDLGREGTGRIYMEQGMTKNNFPTVRTMSVRMLGEIGGEDARRAVIDVLGQENEPMVMSEAVFALAKIGPDEAGITLQVMASAMNSQTAMNRDNNFAYAYVLSIEMMFENGYDITDPYLYDELIKITNSRNGYNTEVRKKAMEVLNTIQ